MGTPDWEGGVGRSRPRAHAARVSWSAEPSHAAERGSDKVRRRVRAVALEGDASSKSLRFDFFAFVRAVAMDGALDAGRAWAHALQKY